MSTFMTGTKEQGVWDFVEKGQVTLLVAAIVADPVGTLKMIQPDNPNGNTVLHVLAMKGDEDTLKAVIAVVDPKNLNTPNKSGYSPLMAAGAYGQLAAALALMAAGAEINYANKGDENLLSQTIKGMNQDDVRPAQREQFEKILDAAIERGAKVTPKVLDVADLFEDDKTLSRMQSVMAAQKAAPATASPAKPAVPAPASKMG